MEILQSGGKYFSTLPVPAAEAGPKSIGCGNCVMSDG